MNEDERDQDGRLVVAPWRVTVGDVLDLVPTLGVVASREPGVASGQEPDPWAETTAEKRISEDMVVEYIRLVSSRVVARLSRWSAIPESSPFRESLLTAARDSTINGAASYAYAAAAPEKAGLAQTTNYSEVLWQRHLDSLDLARGVLDEWDGDDDDGRRRKGRIRGSFPCPAFRDDVRW